MNPFERLGIAKDADEREVKRAYARELKRARPDQDPQAFQALHEAYSHCLDQARLRAQAPAEAETHDDEYDYDDEAGLRLAPDEFRRMLDRVAEREFDSGTRPIAIELVVPAAPLPIDPGRAEPMPAPPWRYQRRSPAPGPQAWPRLEIPGAADYDAFDRHGFDPEAVIDELIELARTRPVREIERRLHAHPDLYAVERKQAIANALVERLLDEASLDEPPLPLAALEALLRFFDLDAIHPRFPHRHEQVSLLRQASLPHGAVIRELGGEYRDPATHRRQRSRELRWFWFWIAALFAIALLRVLVAAGST